MKQSHIEKDIKLKVMWGMVHLLSLLYTNKSYYMYISILYISYCIYLYSPFEM